jgi:hypothetical protein
VRAQRDGIVAVPLGRELGAARASGLLRGLRDVTARPAGDRGDLQVERRGVGQHGELLAEALVELTLRPQPRDRGRVLPSRLLQEGTGTLLREGKRQGRGNGPGLLLAPHLLLGVAGVALIALIGLVAGTAERRPPVAGVVHRAAAVLRRIRPQAVLLLPPGPRRSSRRAAAPAAGPDAPLLLRDRPDARPVARPRRHVAHKPSIYQSMMRPSNK